MELKTIVENNKIKFTKPQQHIVNRLLSGDILVDVNTTGNKSEYMWLSKNAKNSEYAGKVYKAFWNIFYEIKKQTGIVLEPGDYLKPFKN